MLLVREAEHVKQQKGKRASTQAFLPQTTRCFVGLDTNSGIARDWVWISRKGHTIAHASLLTAVLQIRRMTSSNNDQSIPWGCLEAGKANAKFH